MKNNAMNDVSGFNGVISGYNQKKLSVARRIDRVLNVFSYLFKKRADGQYSNPKKILIVQSHLIGDLVMSTPLIRAVRNAYPDAEILLLANPFAEDILGGSPLINRIITMRFPWATHDYGFKSIYKMVKIIKHLRAEGIDMAIDAQIDMRNAFLLYLSGAVIRAGCGMTGGGVFLTHQASVPENVQNVLEARLFVLNALEINAVDTSTELPITEDSLEDARRFLDDNGLDGDKTVIIHPCASTKEKLWMPERFARLNDAIFSTGKRTVIAGGPTDYVHVSKIINLCKMRPVLAMTTLRSLAAIVSLSRMVICLDSAAVHISAAVGTPVLAIYGPKWPHLTRPFIKDAEIIFKDGLGCRPCEYGKCKRPHSTCMDLVEEGEVMERAMHLMARTGGMLKSPQYTHPA